MRGKVVHGTAATTGFRAILGMAVLAASGATVPAAEAASDPSLAITNAAGTAGEQSWNWHTQNTDIAQYHPGFSALYSGPNSLRSVNEVKETVSVDLFAGARLWRGAEAHIDGLMWQGFGLSKTLGVEAFPDGEAFRLGTKVPNVNIARLFLRQTINLGGEQEDVADNQLQLAGRQDVSRITLTLGKLSAKDIFDNNAYANDPRTQFMSWAFMANEAWDFPADSIGYTTGFAVELDEPQWAVRYGFFQMPRTSNGTAQDSHYLEAWGMVTEFERRYALAGHPGAVRLLAYLNRANMGSYAAAVASPVRPADIEATREYRYKYGFGLNVEQELARNVGAFTRLGWSDGQNEAWAFADVDRTATLGVSVKGESWGRPNDTFGLAGALNAISREHRDFLAAGGLGILAGDGALNYGLEQSLETYYDFHVWRTIHATIDYQFIANPAFNRDRGPVSVFGARLHWEL
ncbi:MAG TPA: carbohydrate porin [Candidatus Acidoferrum sp.]|jgi:high affinity Mn2+ porin|nr:carbohydrate porin [Candidatus Acidoferrum sp.]